MCCIYHPLVLSLLLLLLLLLSKNVFKVMLRQQAVARVLYKIISQIVELYERNLTFKKSASTVSKDFRKDIE